MFLDVSYFFFKLLKQIAILFYYTNTIGAKGTITFFSFKREHKKLTQTYLI